MRKSTVVDCAIAGVDAISVKAAKASTADLKSLQRKRLVRTRDFGSKAVLES